MRGPALPLVAILALALTACVNDDQTTTGSTAIASSASASGSGTRTPPSSPPGGTTSPSPPPEPDLQLPADAPTSIDDPADVALIEAGDHSVLIPPGAQGTIAVRQAKPDDPIDQIAVAWRRGSDPFASEVGLVVWQRFEEDSEAGWRVVYAFTDRPSAGVLGLRLVPSDLTGDGVDDLLTEEQRGGSGACATWRVIASADGGATEIFRRDACDTEITSVEGSLEIREAVYEAGDPHCCPSAYRTTILEWDGQSWAKVSSEVEPAG